MDFATYQVESRKFAKYPSVDGNIFYPALGLAGESGEVCEKIKKIFRDKNGEYTEEDKKQISKEIGDVTWYCAALASEFGLDFNEIAIENIAKLQSRKDRGVLGGSGDNR